MDGVGTVVECLMRVLEAAKEARAGASQKGGDAFWLDSMRQVLRYTLQPLYAAHGAVSIPGNIRFITSALQDLKQPKSSSLVGWNAVTLIRSPRFGTPLNLLQKVEP